jgi:hypothetical protein
MMKSTEVGLCKDVSERLDWARTRRILCQSEMRPDLVVVSSIGFEDPAQVAFAQDHDMIQALPTDRADHPFHMSVLPG